MNATLAHAIDTELQQAADARAARDYVRAFRQLERAHVLGQRATARHLRVHVEMLRIGWLRRDPREVIGQVLRIAAAAAFSRIWVPLGNTGGANVSALQPMPIADDLAALLRREG